LDLVFPNSPFTEGLLLGKQFDDHTETAKRNVT